MNTRNIAIELFCQLNSVIHFNINYSSTVTDTMQIRIDKGQWNAFALNKKETKYYGYKERFPCYFLRVADFARNKLVSFINVNECL